MRNPALLPRVRPAVIEDPHAPLSTLQWTGQKSDGHGSKEKATFDLIATEGDISTESGDQEELSSYREEFRERRHHISYV